MPLQSEKWSPYAVIIAQGQLPAVSVGIDAEGGHKAYVNTPSRTYADFIKAWALQRGDQLTFVTVQKLQGEYEVNYARIVLNPRNADGSGAPMTTEIVNSEGEFPCSHWKNGRIYHRARADHTRKSHEASTQSGLYQCRDNQFERRTLQ